MYSARKVITHGSSTQIQRIRSLARDQCEQSLNVIISIRDSEDVDPRTRLAAANMLLDRGLGKPKETIVNEDMEGNVIRPVITEIVQIRRIPLDVVDVTPGGNENGQEDRAASASTDRHNGGGEHPETGGRGPRPGNSGPLD